MRKKKRSLVCYNYAVTSESVHEVQCFFSHNVAALETYYRSLVADKSRQTTGKKDQHRKGRRRDSRLRQVKYYTLWRFYVLSLIFSQVCALILYIMMTLLYLLYRNYALARKHSRKWTHGQTERKKEWSTFFHRGSPSCRLRNLGMKKTRTCTDESCRGWNQSIGVHFILWTMSILNRSPLNPS